MKFFTLFSAALLAVSFFGGCASYVTVNGEKFVALTDAEKDHLVEISRASLYTSMKEQLITADEYRDAINEEPSIRIDYRGDKFGTATISWRTSGRKLEFFYYDNITDEIIPRCAFAVSVIPDEERRIVPDKSIPGR